MGAMKKLLPDDWYDIKEEDIVSINVAAAGFEATMTPNDDGTVSDNFGHAVEKERIGGLKEIAARLIESGFEVEIITKKKMEEMT